MFNKFMNRKGHSGDLNFDHNTEGKGALDINVKLMSDTGESGTVSLMPTPCRCRPGDEGQIR
jgi:hypothetical protein